MENPRILLVDDDTVFTYFLVLKLKYMGYENVVCADSYESAMAALNQGRPDLILMDININGFKNGIEVIKDIHSSDIIPTIFMSATCDLQEIRSASSMANCQYMYKPVDLEELFNKIELITINISDTYVRV